MQIFFFFVIGSVILFYQSFLQSFLSPGLHTKLIIKGAFMEPFVHPCVLLFIKSAHCVFLTQGAVVPSEFSI